MQQLKVGSLLQGGKYKIEKVLGQGGFGITYLATQDLLDRKVCIKEFFFKEYCERDETTSHVSLGTQSNHEIVERFMNKFLKEARTISTLNHPHIIRIYDIFKENNTAYYVMECIEGESLNEMVNRRGALPESEAFDYIKQVASALDFIHQRSINHLDVKPANIMVSRSNNKAILIDFGLSKQYDAQGGQTSTTPVGISHGYAPMEQYKQGGVSTFSPQTDIYALGATLYKLVTGNTPPQAMDILDVGLPELPFTLSTNVKNAINQAMQVRKIDRPEDVRAFLDLMKTSTSTIPREETKIVQTQDKSVESEETMVLNKPEVKEKVYSARCVDDSSKPNISIEPEEGKKKRNYIPMLIGAVVIFIGIIAFAISGLDNGEPVVIRKTDAIANELEEKRVNDSIANVRREETEKRRNDSINAINEQARLAALHKKEEEKRKKTHGTINGHEWVDLGLSVMWATCNVGASKPYEIGDYFAWGETSTKVEYLDENCSSYLENIGDISGNPKYDVARFSWGGSWRLPTKNECKELVDKCKWILTVQNNHNGFKIVGPNGNSIFLPTTGYYGKSILYPGLARYWSSTPHENYTENAFHLGSAYVYWCSRSCGFNVRPVSD